MVISCTHFTLDSSPIILKLLLLLPAALEVLINEVTFFLHQYDSTIISSCVRIFMQPRLNTEMLVGKSNASCHSTNFSQINNINSCVLRPCNFFHF